MTSIDRQLVYQSIAHNLREFGCGDVSAKMIAEVDQAIQDDQPLPHGVVGARSSRHPTSTASRSPSSR